jgi:hypothetical protein
LVCIAALAVAGCSPTVYVADPPAAVPKSAGVAPVDFSGSGSDILARAVTDVLAGGSGPDLRLVGDSSVRIHDQRGKELVQVRKQTGRIHEATVQDPFVDQPFTVKQPEEEIVAVKLPYVQRTSEMTLRYRLMTPDGRVADQDTVTINDVKKYGGVNEHAGRGLALADLPGKEAEAQRLAEIMAQRLAPRLNRAAGKPVVPLDRGQGFWKESQIKKGAALAGEGKWDEAVHLWRAVVAEDPGHPAANYNLGVARERTGRVQDLPAARKYYARAVKNGDNPIYREALVRTTAVLNRLRAEDPAAYGALDMEPLPELGVGGGVWEGDFGDWGQR